MLHERASSRGIAPEAKAALRATALKSADSLRRLRALWTTHLIGDFSGELPMQCLADSDEYVRAWTIQLSTEDGLASPALLRRFTALARTDPSPIVRLYLASAIQRVPEETAWQLVESLTRHGADREDRNLPMLIWDAIALRMTAPNPAGIHPPHEPGGARLRRALISPRQKIRARRSLAPPFMASMRGGKTVEALPEPGSSRREEADYSKSQIRNPKSEIDESLRTSANAASALDRAFAVAEQGRIPQLTDWIYWYAATFEGGALNRVVVLLEKLEGETLRRRLAGIELAMSARANVKMPPAWKKIAARLYGIGDSRVVRQAERLAAVFGDSSMFPRLRETLANSSIDADARKHAFAVLSRALDRASLPVFLGLLEDRTFRSPAINLLARFDSPEVPPALIQRYESFSTSDRVAALNALTGRPSFALTLLDAVASGRLKRDQITAFHIRQLAQLHNAELDKRVAAAWGKIQQSSLEKQTQTARLEKIFDEAPLWAYSADAGREHFQKLCAQCHRVGNDGNRVGPELTGAGRNGIRYFLENIIDPNAVIGTDFQMTTVETRNGEVISGLIVN
ncbi:MAG: hypothetical protein DME18_15700, partial [Verrucomicrobia bacterium]